MKVEEKASNKGPTVGDSKQESKERKIVGKSSSTKTKTKNGKTVTVKTVTIKYSDGTTETTTEEMHS